MGSKVADAFSRHMDSVAVVVTAIKFTVFEPYFTKGDGETGLGLASVRNLACQCGGGVSIESQVGVGTRVSVFLPLAELAGRARASR